MNPVYVDGKGAQKANINILFISRCSSLLNITKQLNRLTILTLASISTFLTK